MNFAKLWPLAVSDILFKFNGDALCTLGCLGTVDQIRDQMLKKWWGIGSRDELFKTLDWLSNEGHSNFHRALNAGQFSAEEYKYQQQLNQLLHDELHTVSLCAWDLGRYMCLVRWGYHAGYVKEEEVWHMFSMVAPILQSSYKSWREFGVHYYYGWRFWAGDLNLKQYENSFSFLLHNPNSPWVYIPWNASLKPDNSSWKTDNPFYLDLNPESPERNKIVEEYYLDMIESDPDNQFCYHFYANFVEFHLGDSFKAFEIHKQSVEIDPSFDVGYSRMVGIWMGRYGDDTIPDKKINEQLNILYQDWIENHTVAKPCIDYALWLMDEQDEPQEALEYFQMAVDLEPENESYINDMGVCYWNLDKIPEAINAFEIAIKINPDDEIARDNLNNIKSV